MESSRGPPRVKNKAPAPIQISSEQLLREAVDRQEEKITPATTRFQDLEELHEYQGRKRREFEDYVRRNRVNLRNWTQYAAFELEQKEYRRARSIFERALDVLPTSTQLWIRYLESEMKTRNINHARNLFDRAVTILPRNDKLWYKYVYFEELLGNIAGTRQVFERWMQWEPDESAWTAYVALEKRYQEYDKARNIFERLTIVHPEPANWLKWAKFEQEFGDAETVREVFGMAIETLGDDFMDERVFIAYGRFETRAKEYERARAIYKFALDRMPRSRSAQLHKTYTAFEKQFGDREGVEDVVLAKRRVQYEERLRASPHDYDAWIDYTRLEESSGDAERTIEVYERAVSHTPPSREKRHWRRYVYLWIFYALWAETAARDAARARAVYRAALELVPHRAHTHAKLWVLAAQFELRQGELGAARRTLGQAIGRCPKDRLFRAYIEMELKLFEFERCRTLHAKRLEFAPGNGAAWIKFAELERGLDDAERARAIFELAVEQAALDMPELVWKAYIDFEEEEGEHGRARALYERLLGKTEHVKVWISYAHFEVNAPGEGEDEAEDEDEDAEEEEDRPVSEAARERARKVFRRAHAAFKANGLKDDRVALLRAWRSFEATHGSEAQREEVERQMPRRVKKRRRVETAAAAATSNNGGEAEAEFEEYLDWVFPADDEGAAKLSKLLAAAQAWKKEQGGTEEGA